MSRYDVQQWVTESAVRRPIADILSGTCQKPANVAQSRCISPDASLVPRQAPLPGKLMLDNRLRVTVPPGNEAGLGSTLRVRVVNLLSFDILQLRYPQL